MNGNVTKRIIELPFPGFYNTMLSHGMDSEEEDKARYRAKLDEDSLPEELRISSDTYEQLVSDFADYPAMFLAVSKEYVSVLNDFVWKTALFNLGLEFEKVELSKDYASKGDRLFAYIDNAVVYSMYTKVSHEALERVIKYRHSDGPGFVSHYSSNVRDWIAKPILSWDHNELGTLLIAFLQDVLPDYRELQYHLSLLIDFSSIVDRHVDWAKLDKRVAELRKEKFDETIGKAETLLRKVVEACDESGVTKLYTGNPKYKLGTALSAAREFLEGEDDGD